MREETRPIFGTLLGIVGGVIATYWAGEELSMLSKATTKTPAVLDLVGPKVKVTAAVLGELKNWFSILLVVEIAIMAAAVLLFLYPRLHFLWGALLLGLAAASVAVFEFFPYGVGKTELFDGLIISPVLGIVGGIAGLGFRSDLEFARSYGFD